VFRVQRFEEAAGGRRQGVEGGLGLAEGFVWA
jgi:hypothetical protein